MHHPLRGNGNCWLSVTWVSMNKNSEIMCVYLGRKQFLCSKSGLLAVHFHKSIGLWPWHSGFFSILLLIAKGNFHLNAFTWNWLHSLDCTMFSNLTVFSWNLSVFWLFLFEIWEYFDYFCLKFEVCIPKIWYFFHEIW